MFILSDETKSLKAQTLAAPGTPLDFIITYNDNAKINIDKGNAAISGTIDENLTEILAAPSDRVVRDVRSISIMNVDNITHNISIYLQDDTDQRLFFSCELLRDERVEFDWDKGWSIYNTKGVKKLSIANMVTDPGVLAIASDANPTINTDEYDFIDITALAVNIASFTTNLTGAPRNGSYLSIRIKDNGTARTIAWGASFETVGAVLPTTTVISKRLLVLFVYDTTTSKWGCVATNYEP